MQQLQQDNNNNNLDDYLNPLTADIQIKGRAHCAELLLFFSFFHLRGVSFLVWNIVEMFSVCFPVGAFAE